jgi:RHS repeat-associated protein
MIQDSYFGELDYGARFYDPMIARWHVPDPLGETNRRFSTYVYGQNNPANMIDVDGLYTTRYYDEDGNLLLNTNDNSDAIVTVSNDKMDAFVESLKSSSPEEVDSKEWNREQVKALTGVEMTDIFNSKNNYYICRRKYFYFYAKTI